MLTAFALKNARLVLLVLGGLLLFGLHALQNFPSQEDPPILVREAVIITYYPGMDPHRVERLITRKIERRLAKVVEKKHLWSFSKTGTSVIHIKLNDRVFNLKQWWQDVRNKVNDIKPELPEGTIGPFVNDEFGDVTIVSAALTAKGFTPAEMFLTAKHLQDELYLVPGVGKVTLYGVQHERIWLEVSTAKLAQFGVGPEVIAAALQRENIILPSGTVDVGGREIIVEPTGNFQGLQDIENLRIEVPDRDGVVYLRDLAQITRGYSDPPQSLVYYNGEPAILIGASMMEGYNVLDVGPRIKQRLEELEQTLPIGYQVGLANYSPQYVDAAVQNVAVNLYETVAIVVGVIILFLGFRMGTVIGLHVPLTMLMTLVFMYLFDIALHRISLATMIISLGVLVDNGIVMGQEIQRRMSEGIERMEACLSTGRDMAMPLLAGSTGVVLAFMPLLLSDSTSGEYCRSLSQVMAITLFSSYGLAMMVMPLLCYRFVKVEAPDPTADTKRDAKPLFRYYRRTLESVLQWRLPFLGLIASVFIAAVFLSSLIKDQFFPESDRPQLMMIVRLPAGYSIRETNRQMQAFVGWLEDEDSNPEITRTIAYVGDGGVRFFVTISPPDPAANMGFVLVTVDDGEKVPAVIERIRNRLLTHFPELLVQLKKMYLGDKETGLVEWRLSGPDPHKLFPASRKIEAALHAIPSVANIYNDWENRVTKAVVDVDQAQARRAGVTSTDIADSLQGALKGWRISDLRTTDRDEAIPIMVRAPADERFDLDRVRSINIYAEATDTAVPMMQIAQFEAVNQFDLIKRRDLAPTITVEAKATGNLSAVQLQDQLLPTIQDVMGELGPGYHWEWGGEFQSSEESSAALMEYAPLCFFGIFLVLVGQFNSFAKPVLVFATIPLGLIGAIVGMILSNAYFGFMAILGIFALAGVTMGNAITLLDRIKLEEESGKSPYEAIMAACLGRLLPIMMTSSTTILGMLPIIISQDPLFYSLANVIAFGLLVGVILTLLVIPVLYALVFRVPVPA